MKIVINTSYGSTSSFTEMNRLNPQFIEDVEAGRFVGVVNEKWGFAETLKVIEIPDEASDYKILNYDGSEIVAYCLDGFLYFTPTNTDAARILRQ